MGFSLLFLLKELPSSAVFSWYMWGKKSFVTTVEATEHVHILCSEGDFCMPHVTKNQAPPSVHPVSKFCFPCRRDYAQLLS